jgi:hypothetical protein
MYKTLIAIAATTLVGVASAQSSGGTTAGEAVNATGRAAAAAVTPGDQNSGRNPENRTGGLMGSDRTGSATSAAGNAANATGRAAAAAVTPGDQNSGRTPGNRTGGIMGTDRTGSSTSAATTTERTTETTVARSARADRN